MKIKKKIMEIVIHIAIWLCIFRFIIPNNMMRPFPAIPYYKEFVITALIMLCSYFLYFFLIPRYYLSGYISRFWIYSLLSLLFICIAELIILIPEYRIMILNCRFYVKIITAQYIFSVIFRNFCILSLLFILRTNKYYKNQIEIQQKTAINNSEIFNIIQNKNDIKAVHLSEIVYIKQNKNYTNFHISDHNVYSMYVSLTKIEEMLPNERFRRINRSTIINNDYLLTESQNAITLSFDDNISRDASWHVSTRDISFKISENFRKEQ